MNSWLLTNWFSQLKHHTLMYSFIISDLHNFTTPRWWMPRCIFIPLEVGNQKYLFVCSLAHYWLFWSVLTVCEGGKVSVALGSGCSGHGPTSIWLGSMRGCIVHHLWSTDTDRAYFTQTRTEAQAHTAFCSVPSQDVICSFQYY